MGQSSGEYKDACVSRWVKDTIALIDWVTKDQAHSKVILVGAGVGGWVMFHAARQRPLLIQGLVICAENLSLQYALLRNVYFPPKSRIHALRICQ